MVEEIAEVEVAEGTDQNQGSKERSMRAMLLYKMDRTIAIVAIVVIALYALYIGTSDAMQIVSIAIGGLVGYLGAKMGNK